MCSQKSANLSRFSSGQKKNSVCTMKARVQSSIPLLTGKSPSPKVECHRTSSGGRSSLTNAFLRKGGALPSVLPGDDTAAQVSSGLKNVTEGKENSSDVKQPPVIRTQHANHRNTCQLEKKMEHLTDKLTKVQDILENHLLDAEPEIASCHMDQDENGSFSASDYTFLLLEMNANMPSRPYDPSEFSQKA